MKKITFFAIALLATISSFAASGWWSDYVTIDINGAGSTAPTGWYWIGSDPSYATQFAGANLGTVSSMVITGCDLKYWSNTQDRAGGAFYYKIMSSDGTTEVVPPVETIWTQTALGGNDYQGTTTVAINLLAGLSKNVTYQSHIWAKSWGTDGDVYLNNSGANYVATFTTSSIITTAPSNLESSLKLSGANGKVSARFDGSANVQLYSAAGQLIRSVNAVNEFSENVQAGMYLVRVNGATHKVMVK